ncbi:ABC transporter permease [Scopulibacillus cellulosilyticus]|uniref:ABC transporter permease n=1 Tax=Scopulibacillus cellulosilyticus TaxID=2665665 RepID=A0ABW2PTF0_9BACL
MRIKALAIRILRQFIRDKRTLALMFIAPLFIMTLLSLVFNGKTYHPSIALVNAPKNFIHNFQKTNASVHIMSLHHAKDALSKQKIDAAISFKNHNPELTLEGSDPTANKAVLQLLSQVTNRQDKGENLQARVHYLHGGKNLTSFDNFGPVLLGFFIFFFVFLIAGVSFLRERTKGTLERLLASPLRRWEVVAGYVSGFGVFTIIQSALIVWYAVYILRLWMAGSIWYVLLITLLLAFTALALGTLLSAFAHNELQLIQFIPLVIVPQVFFSGLFQIETISDWVSWIGPLTPLYYGADALRDVMLRGGSWSDISFDIGILCVFALVFMLLNVLVLRRYRKL